MSSMRCSESFIYGQNMTVNACLSVLTVWSHSDCHKERNDEGNRKEEPIHDGGDHKPVRVVWNQRRSLLVHLIHRNWILITSWIHVDLEIPVWVARHIDAAAFSAQVNNLQKIQLLVLKHWALHNQRCIFLWVFFLILSPLKDFVLRIIPHYFKVLLYNCTIYQTELDW